MTSIEHISSKQMRFMRFGFVTHDAISDFLARYFKHVKRGLLLLAHASLLGLLFPQFSKVFGEVGSNILLGLLIISPLSKIFRMKLLYQLMGLRRELGIGFAYLAIVHSAGYILDPEWFSVFIAPYSSQPLSIAPRYVFGMIALVLTLPLLITSNTLSIRILKGNWKRVHSLVYPMFAFSLMHRFLPDQPGSGSAFLVWMQFVTVFGGYVFLKLLARNNFVAPLRNVIDFVAREYNIYRNEYSHIVSNQPL